MKRSVYEPEYHFFSGKGGVGKTSIASATALWFAERGKKTLIISTDPAHSLSDAFRKKIGGNIKRIEKNLYAVEIDPKKAVEEYRKKFMPEIEKIEFLKGFGINETFDVMGTAPGIDEIASFDKFLQFMNSSEYEVIIFDTAPTGHALRFLSLPDILDSWIGKMIKMRMKFSAVVSMVKRILPFGTPEEDIDLRAEHLDEIKSRIEKAREILSDPERTSYNIVMIPEAMSIYESERSIKVLRDYGIPVKNIIVNQILPENNKCSFCKSKSAQQKKRLKMIRKKFKNYKILEVRLFKEEVHGKKMLKQLARELYG
ncbi:arsenic-transporting ATPase [Candidatus Aerophobetes bacterium]|uniref:arsenite-transporting ATPase n=1 Tax=Aerophobetes bacterium TaxID=2030807 RepID=A0A662D9Y4_UNCAE|nr:MAG: arsenic-transporting ATPase [Candidatus Aerophobetes bacterium]